MAKQDFEQFKQDVKEWLNSHPEEYDRFVAEVNNKSATGLQKVFKLGWKLTPQMMRKYQNECHGDLADEHRLQSYSQMPMLQDYWLGSFTICKTIQ